MSLVKLLGAVDGIISINVHARHLTLAAPKHQEISGQVEVTWRTLRTVAHALMVHARILEIYDLSYTLIRNEHILPEF